MKKELRLQAQDEVYALKKEQEQDFKNRENELKKQESRLQEKEERLETKLEKATQKESEAVELEKRLVKQEKEIAEREEDLSRIIEDQTVRLEEISGLTKDEAKTRLMEDIESMTRHEAARMIRSIESEAKETASKKAKKILALAMQRYAGDYVNEQSVTSITLPSEDMKGPHHRPGGTQHPALRRPPAWTSSSTTPQKPWSCPPTAPCAAKWPGRPWNASSTTGASTPPASRRS